jgi:hypothetical protein
MMLIEDRLGNPYLLVRAFLDTQPRRV